MPASPKRSRQWHCYLVVYFQVLALVCLSKPLHPGEDIPNKGYQKLEEKLRITTDPIKKVKTLIKISDFHLHAAANMVKKEDLTEADRYLSHYRETIRRTQEILNSSGRNAQKKPAGFKDFEIALKRQLRILEDLRVLYPYEQAQKVNETIEQAKAAQEQMLVQIFGEENFRTRKETK